MALTQTATHAGPLWDEEVVPALRKRLESESRTLARRISAISLSSVEDIPVVIDSSNISTPRHQNTRGMGAGDKSATATPTANNINGYTANDRSTSSNGYTQQYNYSPRANGIPASTHNTPKKPIAPNFQRSRTYSQPYNIATDNALNSRTRPAAGKESITKPTRTRIPVASRSTNASSASLIYASTSTSPPPPPPPLPTDYNNTSSSKSSFPVPRSSSFGLINNEQPPFNPSSLSSATTTSTTSYIPAEQPPRTSTDSEERPFEHWYRGDTSRNGGVGELRVGKRQEMLDIANYGHRKASLGAARNDVYEHRFRRKRADSIAGLTNKERQRGSVYLDEERAREVGMVLDEHPLTDLESEPDSAVGSGTYGFGRASEDGYGWRGRSSSSRNSHGNGKYEEENGGVESGDVFDPLPAQILDSYHGEQRSPTPTQASIRTRPQNNYPNGTRIPRLSTESHSVTLTSSPPPASPSVPNAVASSSTSTPSKSPKTQARTNAKSKSPASRKKLQKKVLPKREEMEEENEEMGEEEAGEGDDLKDAIPVWTQPVKQGNWDEVVLPVVARQKGLDGMYEVADGSPQPKKKDDVVAPAPGTFGYDHTKYRPPRNSNAPFELDEFGRPNPPPQSPIVEEDSNQPPQQESNPYEDTPLPVRSKQPLPQEKLKPVVRPVDPSELGLDLEGRARAKAEEREMGRMQVAEPEVEDSGGCCRCVVM